MEVMEGRNILEMRTGWFSQEGEVVPRVWSWAGVWRTAFGKSVRQVIRRPHNESFHNAQRQVAETNLDSVPITREITFCKVKST